MRPNGKVTVTLITKNRQGRRVYKMFQILRRNSSAISIRPVQNR